MPETAALPASPLHALCVYAEPLVAGRRVVVFGDVSHGLGERFLEMGARVVHVYDPDAKRAATMAERAPRGLSVQALPAGDFDVRDGAFDVAVVADVAEVASPASLLARIRKLLAPAGVSLVRSRSVDAGRPHGRQAGGPLDYYELYELVALQFANVRMVGQIPWSGVALAELGRTGGDPDVTVDTQLVDEADAPEAFIAVGSQDEIHLAEYALVQLPPPTSPTLDVEQTIMYGSEKADLAAAQLRASLLDAQLEEQKSARHAEKASHGESLAAIEAELARRLDQLREAELRLVESDKRSASVGSELRGRDEEMARIRDRTALGVRELEDERRLRARVEGELKSTRERLAASALEAQGFATVRERLPRVEAAVAELEAVVLDREQRLAVALHARGTLEVALAAALAGLDAARAELDASRAEQTSDVVDGALVRELTLKVAVLEAELGSHADGHGVELGSFEQALRERAREVQLLEHELARRERIILDLVHAFEEARAHEGTPPAHEAPRVDDGEADAALRRAKHENGELRQRLDTSALEIARREGELTTSTWRIQELEQAVARLEDEQSELTMTIPPPAFLSLEREANDVEKLTQRLAAAEDELDVLRQALAQEHAARVAQNPGAGDGAEAHGAGST